MFPDSAILSKIILGIIRRRICACGKRDGFKALTCQARARENQPFFLFSRFALVGRHVYWVQVTGAARHDYEIGTLMRKMRVPVPGAE